MFTEFNGIKGVNYLGHPLHKGHKPINIDVHIVAYY